MNAACTGCSSPFAARPSTVVISSPSWVTASERQLLIRQPLARTVHAPHCPWSQRHPRVEREVNRLSINPQLRWTVFSLADGAAAVASSTMPIASPAVTTPTVEMASHRAMSPCWSEPITGTCTQESLQKSPRHVARCRDSGLDNTRSLQPEEAFGNPSMRRQSPCIRRKARMRSSL